MVLKIETAMDGRIKVLRLSGRMEFEQVQELKAQIDGNTREIAFDLEQVRLVNLDAAHFLAVCEARGIELRHCPSYVREWVRAEEPRIRERE